MEKTIDDYIEERNELQLKAEGINKTIADNCWAELGVANRHIARVLSGEFRLEVVENEIIKCLSRTRKMFEPTE